MILKFMKLENIRSYQEQTIDFPLGTTLFEGDIGSGKSTILMAIEFALFGLGSEKGGALLRTGSKRGSVTLRFEVNGEEYEVYRSLERKGRGIQQGDDGYIKTKEGILRLSPSEMKAKVLEILNFNEPPDPKAQSIIYRYAVFTPQEEMKAILWMRADSRLQILRKAFRIEDYRIAMDNASNLARLIKEKSIELSSLSSDLEVKREMRKQKEEEVRKKEEHLQQLGKEEESIQNKLNELKEEVEKLRERKEKLAKTVGEIPLLSSEIEEKSKEINEFRSEVEKLSKEIEELQPTIEKLRRIKRPTSKTEETLKEELDELRKLEKKFREKEVSIEAKINDYISIQENKVCPTCDRPADPKEFLKKIEQKEREKKEVSEEVAKYEQKIKETEKLQEDLREYIRAQEMLKNLEEQVKRSKETVERNNSRIKDLVAQVEEASKRLEAAKKEIEELKKVSERINTLNKDVQDVEMKLTNVRGNISSTKTTIEHLKREREELMEDIKRKEEQRKQAERLKEYHIWLQDFFIPTLESIEKHVMININQEFNSHFQKWFRLLVEDLGKEARIDEDFTPIVEQDGYEQDIYYLSGGEKTSIALAYRLALNSIVQNVSVGMKSNLLILDEPTDGFSKEQLFKVRDILNEIKSPQTIIVSHERELESFADQIFKVEKVQGNSKITLQSEV